jgi:hypothetical protein
MSYKQSTADVLLARATTIGSMFRYFLRRGRWLMLPLLIFVLVSGVLLVLTGGLSYVAPFVYAVF